MTAHLFTLRAGTKKQKHIAKADETKLSSLCFPFLCEQRGIFTFIHSLFISQARVLIVSGFSYPRRKTGKEIMCNNFPSDHLLWT